MQSPLHERLEYLVTYSSQLIFVSGDSVAQQQKTLDAFVFNQSEDTDIAYLTAKASFDLSDYRRQLCQQLLGQQVGSYIRPLNELLADLNQHHGPVLITITQAEHIPDAFLQELWDLVLQSRFASNKQHLNVLLFGQSQWAEKAKQWLPAKNTNTPLLISSQSVMAQQTGSELDQLISERRQAFQARLDERSAAQQTITYNRLKSPWFWSSAVILFLLCFTALIGWQYSAEVEALFSPIEKNSPKQDNPIPAPGSAYRDLIEPAPEKPPGDSGEQTASVVPTSERLQPEAKDSGEVTAENQKMSAQPRITDWQSAVKNMNDKRAAQQDQSEDITQQAVQSDNSQSGMAEARQRPQVDSEFAVTFMQQVREVSLQQAEQAVAEPKPEKNTGLDNALLSSLLTSDDVVIQLAGLKDERLLRDFISDHQLQDKIWIYQTQRYGGPWYVLLFKQPFGSVTEARQAMALLPDYPGKGNAFVKGASQVLDEIKASL